MCIVSNCVGLFGRAYGRMPDALGRAPGRIEFIGNHTDYNGGKVLGAAIDRYVVVAAALRADHAIELRSGEGDPVASSIDAITPLSGAASWANYVLGVVQALRDEGMACARGFDLMVASSLPAGAGLSSSAALELATAYAMQELFGFPVRPERSVTLCRRAENEFVGMPCGILDQSVSAFGRRGHLVMVDCKRARIERVQAPAQLRFWIFDSSMKHRLVESLYGQRHDECRQAMVRLKHRFPEAEYLVDISREQLDEARGELPAALYSRARHIIDEHRRVEEGVGALSRNDMAGLGALLFASHESSRNLFENSAPELDAIVACLRGSPGVHGARLSGGGFGGAVLAVASDRFSDSDARGVVSNVRQTIPGCDPTVFAIGIGDGASVVSLSENES